MALRPSHSTVRRFELGTRLLHGLNAATFLALLVSGLLIYVPELKAHQIGGYRLLPLAHIVFGAAFIASPVVVVLVVRRRQALVADVAGALTPVAGDVRWLNYAALAVLGARVRAPRTGKFNAGQKLNAWYWLLASLALAATGIVLAVNFFTKDVFDALLVERVFPIHEAIALVSIIPLAAHLYLALVNPSTRPALPGMIAGDVDAAWAREHHAGWYDE